MKYVLTGVAGFIGSNLAAELLKRGNEVVGVDDLSTGYRGNISTLRGLGRFKFYEEDVNSPDLAELFGGAEVVCHLAALPRVSFSIDHPTEANHANIDGTLNVLEAARKSGVRRVVFSSSSAIYGGQPGMVFPTPETATPNPLSPYALHKLAGEYYMRLYSNLHGLDTCCLRYFNVTGVGQRAGSAYATVIPAWMEKAANGGTCLVNGDGEVSRDFCPVENVVQANILASQHPGAFQGDCFNIALGETHTINEVYDKICALTGFNVAKIHGPARLGDPLKSLADITKAKTVLGYSPVISFDGSLEKTWKWWKNGQQV